MERMGGSGRSRTTKAEPHGYSVLISPMSCDPWRRSGENRTLSAQILETARYLSLSPELLRPIPS